ncbi:PHB depolymerase family esterase [Rhizobacter sp. J219]|uniref:extracellular catalytic domain type 1 short-chain-length polyhydroxyalkanoate depolymerase n=1 Tax=Rhizobacter sp. J219 TaxID=2898430 RepID=UPI002151985B|nr:PHB depolymerase family esterase [Rhizobacter sp. J219]MCR5883985.1 PHB depolymerase family esterase [Rhizobacter sp. J219]
MAKRTLASAWAKSFERSVSAWTRAGLQHGRRQLGQVTKAAVAKRQPPPGPGDWLPGVAMGLTGMLRFHVYRPPGLHYAERVPVVVMLHGCGQDARSFALSTRMNRVADKERFLVLYPEQDRVANPQGCWNWFDTRSGRAHQEAALILKAIDQVALFYPADVTRVALVGLSAGASMAALLATRHPQRFRSVVMHSGVAPGSADSSTGAMRAMRGRQLLTPLPVGEALPPLMVIHGAHDTVVSSRNARAAASLWADAAGATASEARRVQRGQRHAMTITEYHRRGRDVATLVEIDTLGHAWSGGAARKPYSDSRGPDASRLAWAFARKQFRP